MESILALMIPIVALSIPIVAIWTRHRQKIAEMQIRATAQSSAGTAGQHAAHIRALEERVRVLERIVTDRGHDVAAQIEALRDARSIEDRATEKAQ
ncbi:MAG: hypothetical protein RIQ46_911 [Pseudomonadota bacterium]|jgi:hypothetical protein